MHAQHSGGFIQPFKLNIRVGCDDIILTNAVSFPVHFIFIGKNRMPVLIKLLIEKPVGSHHPVFPAGIARPYGSRVSKITGFELVQVFLSLSVTHNVNNVIRAGGLECTLMNLLRGSVG